MVKDIQSEETNWVSMSQYFEQAAITWDNDPGRQNMATAISTAMIQTLNPDGSELVLDYGAGTGLISLKLYSSVKKILAADTAENMRLALEKKLKDEGITTIETTDWNIGQDTGLLPRFDIIICSMTLHHIADTGEAARVFYSLLKPGGQIAIADLDHDGGEFHEPGIAIHDGFERQNLMGYFSAAGFQDVTCRDVVTITKMSSLTREPRDFPIFLMHARRDADSTRKN